MVAGNGISALVLAAGLGLRLGGLNKPMIKVNDNTLIVQLVESLLSAGINPIVIVISSFTANVETELIRVWGALPQTVEFVHVESGQEFSHSIQSGLRQVANWNYPVMVCLADQPLIDALAITRLMQAYADKPDESDMVVPWVNEQPGNPVVLSQNLVQEWLCTEPSHIGKAWRIANPERVFYWSANCASYIEDIDTPQDLEKLLRDGVSVVLGDNVAG